MKNIAIIGFMGAGKTAVGRELADRLHREFVEMDSLVEHRAGKSVARIFEEDGEAAFRQLEIEVTREVSLREGTVIACGGGVVLNQINVDRLRPTSRIVYLTASPAVILKRIAGDDRRPLLNVTERPQAIRELLKLRQPLYRRAADIVIDTSRLSVDAVAQRIIKKIRDDEGSGP